MVSSSVGIVKEVCCKLWISVGFGEEIGREVVSLLSEWGGMLEESKSGRYDGVI